MADYADYMREEGLAKGQQNLVAGQAMLADMLQKLKNRSSPVVAGGGARVVNSAYSGSLKGMPTMKGKVNPVTGKLSQGWGASRIKYAAGRHTGVDYGVKSGSRVGSAASGIVTRVGSEGAYGNAIHVRHGDGTTTLYAHLSGINVKAGQKVKAGQQIGLSGNTGRSFGAHLHFEVRKQDRYGGDVDPRSWFSTR